jgi:chromosome segregation ATPase
VVVSTERDDLRQRVAGLAETKAKLEQAVSRTQEELTTAQAQMAQLQESQATLSRSVEERDRQITQLRGEMEGLQSERQSLAGRVEQFNTEQESLRQQLKEAERQRTDLEMQLQEQLARPTVQLDKIVVTSNEEGAAAEDETAAEAPRQPQGTAVRNGQVIVVNRKYDFIVMNLGKNHGLAIGQEFEVLQGEKVLGKVRVEKLYDELSAATILPEAQKDSIKEGDAVRAL